MRAWMLPAGSQGFDELYMTELTDPSPGPGEVLIAPQAWSINYRDFAVAQGTYFNGILSEPAIPMSDAAGEVVAIGENVINVRPGDRVQSVFFLDWLTGPQRESRALGDGVQTGVLAERVVLPASAVLPIPANYSFADAACMPGAGVTVWNALFEGGRPITAGSKVLAMGTGGVSMIALEVAKAVDAEVIVTSSSDEKLERVKAMGASHTLNYHTDPDWGAIIAREWGGVDKILEVGGTGTLPKSIEALGFEGEIALIGVLADGDPPNTHPLMLKGGALRGIFCGSRDMAEKLNTFVEEHDVKPPIGARFGFDDVAAAFAFGWGSESFGKTVIELRQERV